MSIHRLGKSLLLALVAAFVVVPAQAQICAPFTDVAASNPFCANIQWMFNRGVTTGCGTNVYCPLEFVPREQMAAFMNRLADNAVFQQGGNAFGTTAVLGTTDARSLLLRVNGMDVLELTPATNSTYGFSPNIVGGHPSNGVGEVCPGICLPPAPPIGATIGGGGWLGFANEVTDSWGVVSGGRGNRAGNANANGNDGRSATVSGGESNIASGLASTVGGGFNNVASADQATVPGGSDNEASGSHSIAAGRRAKALARGCFAWGDDSNFDIVCAMPNLFVARATGGVQFITGIGSSGNPTHGVQLFADDSSWGILSDRASKTNWRDVDTRQVLERLAAMPIGEWNYIGQSDPIRHMGPSAQDFRAAFGLGHNEVSISTVDADGVAFAAIQGLNRKLEQKIATLEAALQALAEEVRMLRSARRD